MPKIQEITKRIKTWRNPQLKNQIINATYDHLQTATILLSSPKRLVVHLPDGAVNTFQRKLDDILVNEHNENNPPITSYSTGNQVAIHFNDERLGEKIHDLFKKASMTEPLKDDSLLSKKLTDQEKIEWHKQAIAYNQAASQRLFNHREELKVGKLSPESGELKERLNDLTGNRMFQFHGPISATTTSALAIKAFLAAPFLAMTANAYAGFMPLFVLAFNKRLKTGEKKILEQVKDHLKTGVHGELALAEVIDRGEFRDSWRRIINPEEVTNAISELQGIYRDANREHQTQIKELTKKIG